MEDLAKKIKKDGSKDIPKVEHPTGCQSQGSCQRCSK